MLKFLGESVKKARIIGKNRMTKAMKIYRTTKPKRKGILYFDSGGWEKNTQKKQTPAGLLCLLSGTLLIMPKPMAPDLKGICHIIGFAAAKICDIVAA